MKLTIELPDNWADLISDWASIRRTLTQALQTTTDSDCANELEEIIPAIESVQFAIRRVVWEQTPNRTEARKRNGLG